MGEGIVKWWGDGRLGLLGNGKNAVDLIVNCQLLIVNC